MNVGTEIWAVRWGENNSWFIRIAGTLFIGVIASAIWASTVMHLDKKEFSYWPLIPGALCAIAAFVLLAPDRYAHVLGKDGFALTLVRHGVIAKKWVIRFADVDDIDTTYTRIVTDGHSQIYTKTKVQIGFLARNGDVLIELEDYFHEPWQQQHGWTPTEPVDLSLVDRLPGTNEARLGFDAMKAWKASKQMPHDGIYR